jgi:hypothetical protein
LNEEGLKMPKPTGRKKILKDSAGRFYSVPYEILKGRKLSRKQAARERSAGRKRGLVLFDLDGLYDIPAKLARPYRMAEAEVDGWLRRVIEGLDRKGGLRRYLRQAALLFDVAGRGFGDVVGYELADEPSRLYYRAPVQQAGGGLQEAWLRMGEARSIYDFARQSALASNPSATGDISGRLWRMWDASCRNCSFCGSLVPPGGVTCPRCNMEVGALDSGRESMAYLDDSLQLQTYSDGHECGIYLGVSHLVELLRACEAPFSLDEAIEELCDDCANLFDFIQEMGSDDPCIRASDEDMLYEALEKYMETVENLELLMDDEAIEFKDELLEEAQLSAYKGASLLATALNRIERYLEQMDSEEEVEKDDDGNVTPITEEEVGFE